MRAGISCCQCSRCLGGFDGWNCLDNFSRLDFQVLSTKQLLPKCLAQDHQRVWQQSVQVDQVQYSALAGKGGSFGRHCWGCKTDLEPGR